MAQVHFVAPENMNKICAGSKRAACGKLRIPGRYINGKDFESTEKVEAVTCPKCAAKLGVELKPVVKPEGSEGTCQCCFNTQKTPKGMLSHHGYKAPGYGYHVGSCRGQKALPYEKSCEVTKAFRAEIANWVEGRRERLADLQNGKVTTLLYTTTDYNAPRSAIRERPSITVTISVGDAAKFDGRNEFPSFERRLDNEIRSVQMNITAGEAQVRFLDEKIAAWVAPK